MGLIARVLEAAGVPTLCMSSALSITQSVNPPRAVFVDFPLGHTSGKPFDTAQQDDLMARALAAFDTIDTPGEVRRLPDCWAANDDWKLAILKDDADSRTERQDQPQYQTAQDAQLAATALAAGGCPTCVWIAG